MTYVWLSNCEDNARHHRSRTLEWLGAQLLVMCVLLGCFGCRTQSAWKLPQRSIGYSDEEVFSRTWTNREGRAIQVIDSTVKKSGHCGDFLVVKVGDRQTKEAFFCEIYLIKRIPSQQRLDTSRADLPMRLLPEHNVNALLSRTGLDSGRFTIGGIVMKEEANKVVFSIDQRANHQYYWKQYGSRKIADLWDEGVIHTLTLTRDYEPSWTLLTYSGPPQVAAGAP
jgi:hypothetical protein